MSSYIVCPYCKTEQPWKSAGVRYQQHVAKCKPAMKLLKDQHAAELKLREEKLADSYDQINTLKAKFEAAQNNPIQMQKLFDEVIAESKSTKETTKQIISAGREYMNNSAKELKRVRKIVVDMSIQLGKVQEGVDEINTKTDQQTELMVRGMMCLGNQLSGMTQQLNNTTNTISHEMLGNSGVLYVPPAPLMITTGQYGPNIREAVDNIDNIALPNTKTTSHVKNHVNAYVSMLIPPHQGIEGTTVIDAINDPDNAFHDVCRNHLAFIYERHLVNNNKEVRDYAGECLNNMGERDTPAKRPRPLEMTIF